jgi:hypothetical protein
MDTKTKKQIMRLDADGPDDPNFIVLSIPDVLQDVVICGITVVVFRLSAS